MEAEAGLAWSNIAESAYKAYSASTNNKNFLGKEMPAFADLPDTIKVAWEAAVRQAGSCIEDRIIGNEQRWNGWKPLQ